METPYWPFSKWKLSIGLATGPLQIHCTRTLYSGQIGIKGNNFTVKISQSKVPQGVLKIDLYCKRFPLELQWHVSLSILTYSVESGRHQVLVHVFAVCRCRCPFGSLALIWSLFGSFRGLRQRLAPVPSGLR